MSSNEYRTEPYDEEAEHQAYLEYKNACRLARLPKCCECGEPIDQEYAVHIGNDWYCDSCLTDLMEETDPDN